jgi:dTDP-4-amino-4,6-dideoxygalactose transaminase
MEESLQKAVIIKGLEKMSFDPFKEYALEELTKKGYKIDTPWDAVDLFEKKVAKYAGSKYAVAVDNCTDAIFLCLKYLKCEEYPCPIHIPKQTYVSIPMTIHNAGCKFKFKDYRWEGLYQLDPYPIYDSALRFTKGMYIQDSFQCLSFHRKKILKLTKGGMILTNDKNAADWFKTVRAKGRHPHENVMYTDEKFTEMGWNMYLPPEYAARGILIFDQLPEHNDDAGGFEKYHDLTKHPVFFGEQS